MELFYFSDSKKKMVRSGAGVIANISVQLNKPDKHHAKFCLSRVLLK